MQELFSLFSTETLSKDFKVPDSSNGYNTHTVHSQVIKLDLIHFQTHAWQVTTGVQSYLCYTDLRSLETIPPNIVLHKRIAEIC